MLLLVMRARQEVLLLLLLLCLQLQVALQQQHLLLLLPPMLQEGAASQIPLGTLTPSQTRKISQAPSAGSRKRAVQQTAQHPTQQALPQRLRRHMLLYPEGQQQLLQQRRAWQILMTMRT